jgi:hypothetical protein
MRIDAENAKVVAAIVNDTTMLLLLFVAECLGAMLA